MTPRFTVVTPSFRSGRWLPLCIASVADQTGVSHEHIVQDSCSDDGTQEWLTKDSRVRAFIEKDQGMYDAINRGLERASGEFLAYLNCDEQYLPGTLQAVTGFFDQHPEVDVVFADIVIVNDKGEYLCHRKVQTPLKFHTWTCTLSTLSCAMFFRRRIFFEKGFKFRPDWRDAGDGDWVLRLLKAGIKMEVIHRFTSAFAFLGTNMSAGPNSRKENALLRESAPKWVQALRPAIKWHHRMRRLLGGMYRQDPFDYAIFTQDSPQQRKVFHVNNPTFRAPGISGDL
jgi:glycosyltransferase involved in cell wall biosynthesis